LWRSVELGLVELAPSRPGLDSGQARRRWYILGGMQTHSRTKSSHTGQGMSFIIELLFIAKS